MLHSGDEQVTAGLKRAVRCDFHCAPLGGMGYKEYKDEIETIAMTLLFAVILIALVFEYVNGFHDTANSIATVVSTKVLTPRQAVMLAAGTNLLGALWGTAVARTIASGLINTLAGGTELADSHLRAAGGDFVEPDDLVGGSALEFEPRADWRAVRRGARRLRQPLVGDHLVPARCAALVSRQRASVESRPCRW